MNSMSLTSTPGVWLVQKHDRRPQPFIAVGLNGRGLAQMPPPPPVPLLLIGPCSHVDALHTYSWLGSKKTP